MVSTAWLAIVVPLRMVAVPLIRPRYYQKVRFKCDFHFASPSLELLVTLAYLSLFFFVVGQQNLHKSRNMCIKTHTPFLYIVIVWDLDDEWAQ